MSELKPCPFCGNDVKVGIEGFVGSTAVECYHCGAKGPESENPSRAEIAWNRRPQPEATKDDSLRTSLADLATALWRTHYRSDSPNFELLPDAAGILSQIDNMVSGLVKPEATKPAQDLSAAILALPLPKPDGWNHSTEQMRDLLKAAAALASPAKAPASPHPLVDLEALEASVKATRVVKVPPGFDEHTAMIVAPDGTIVLAHPNRPVHKLHPTSTVFEEASLFG